MKQGDLEEDFSIAWVQCCKYLQSDGSFTGKEVKAWTETLDSVLCRKVLQILIQVKWSDFELARSAHKATESPSIEDAAAEGGS